MRRRADRIDVVKTGKAIAETCWPSCRLAINMGNAAIAVLRESGVDAAEREPQENTLRNGASTLVGSIVAVATGVAADGNHHLQRALSAVAMEVITEKTREMAGEIAAASIDMELQKLLREDGQHG